MWIGESVLRQKSGADDTGEALIALRSEKIALHAAMPNGSVNAVPGRIVAFNYFGSTHHLIVETKALGAVRASVRAWQAAVEPEIGREVFVSWLPDASVIVRDDM